MHRPQENFDLGPELLVQQGIVDRRIPRCAAQQTAQWLLGREVLPEEDAWIDALAGDFVSSDYSFRTLVKAIVRSDAYRRVE